jgi:allantoin racemase
MKLWYQSLSHRAQANPYGVALARILASVADPDTTIHMQGVERSAGIGQHYRLLEHHDTSEVIENALRAQQQGFDAFLIGNISDAGIHEAREQVAIPVLGMGETCMHLACMMGARFGLVAISERWIPRLGENVRRYGLERHLAGIESMRTSPVDLKKGLADADHKADLLGQFTSAAARLLDRGAEVIIPAGGEVVVFTVEAGMYEFERAPIVNGIVELVKMGEMAAKLFRLTGRFTSRRGGYGAPGGDLLARVRAHYGPHVYPGAE